MWVPSTIAFRRWPIVVIPLLTFILWHAATIYNATDEFPSSSSSKPASDYLSWLPSGLKHPGFDPSSHHVFIATQPNWHEQVWLTIGGMLSSLKVPYTAYTECDDTAEGETCIRFGLLEMAAVLGVWNGGPVKKKSELFNDVNKPLPNGKYVDTVILATEKEDFQWGSERLLQLWNERPDGQKFKVVGVYHEPTGDLEHYSRQWAHTGALSYLTLSPHVAADLKHRLRIDAARPEGGAVGVDHIPVRTVVPWMPAADHGVYVPEDKGGMVTRLEHTLPTRIVINGMISPERRGYDRVFDDMKRLFLEDAKLFGYRWSETESLFVPIDKDDPNTFKLLLLGETDVRVDRPDPGTVREAVEFISGYSQGEFYQYMASADLMLLAWNDAFRYLDSQASSSAFTTLETEVPLVITPGIEEQYSFLDSSISVIRPNALREMDVVALFRKFPNAAKMTYTELERQLRELYSAETMHLRTVPLVIKMLKDGWKRSPGSWKSKKAALRHEQERVLMEILSEPFY